MSKSTDATNHGFDPMSIPGLSYRAREAINATFEAMATWRSEIAHNNEKNIKRVIDKMSVTAAELGWPDQVVDTARTQLRNLTEMQIKTMDQLMDAWEAQLKSPNAASPSVAFSTLKSSPGSWPADAFGMTTPLQFWMSFAEQWQKSWADMITTWTNGQRSSDNRGGRRD